VRIGQKRGKQDPQTRTFFSFLGAPLVFSSGNSLWRAGFLRRGVCVASASVMSSSHVYHLYHRSSPGMRTFCNLLIFFASAAVVMCVLGIICLASSGKIGYCTVMSFGGFVSLLVIGVALAVFCFCLSLLHCLLCQFRRARCLGRLVLKNHRYHQIHASSSEDRCTLNSFAQTHPRTAHPSTRHHGPVVGRHRVH
jgi:hypothetical protein